MRWAHHERGTRIGTAEYQETRERFPQPEHVAADRASGREDDVGRHCLPGETVDTRRQQFGWQLLRWKHRLKPVVAAEGLAAPQDGVQGVPRGLVLLGTTLEARGYVVAHV